MSATTEAGALARHVAAGIPTVSPEERAARMAIRRACEKFDAAKNRYTACGCELKLKTAWRLEHCPLKKWPKPEATGGDLGQGG